MPIFFGYIISVLAMVLLFQKDKNWSVMKCLLAKLNGNGGGALLWAALNGNSEGVKQLLDAGVDVNSKCDIFFSLSII